MSRAAAATAVLGVLAIAQAASGAGLPDLKVPRMPRSLDAGVQLERLFGLPIDEIRFVAAPDESQDELLALTGLAAGKPYVASEVRRAVELLYQLGRFDNVYVSAARVAHGVDLEFVLPPRPHIREIKISGNESLSASAIEAAIDLHRGAELDVRQVAAKREKLAAELRRRGHRSPAIGIASERVDLNGNFDLTIRIDEGPRTRLRQLIVEGTPRKPMPWVRMNLGLDAGDVLDLDRVSRALEALREDYRKNGYLEARIQEPIVRATNQFKDGEPLADLVIGIRAGPRVRVRFSGNTVVALRALEDAAAVMKDPAVGTSPAALNEIRDAIVRLYQQRGYWQVEVEVDTLLAPSGDQKLILFTIHEGQGSYVASLSFPGNTAFSDDTLRDRLHQVVETSLSDVVGRPGVDPEVITSMFGDASVPRADSVAPDTTAPDVRVLYVPDAYRAAIDEIADMYRGAGYPDVVVGTSTTDARPGGPLVRPRSDGVLLDISIPVRPGVRRMIGALSFVGNESVSAAKLLELSQMDPGRPAGEPLSYAKVDEARRALEQYYRNEGYLYARVSEEVRAVTARGSSPRQALVPTSSAAGAQICAEAIAEGKLTCDVELVFRVVEGPQVRARSVVVRGVQDTNESLVRNEIAFEEGGVLRESDMVATRINLLRVGVFEQVAVRLIDQQQQAPEKDVLCEVHERKAESVEVGVGASTAEGARVFASYAHQNVFGTALRFHSNVKVNYNPPRLSVLFYDPAIHDQILNFYKTLNGIAQVQALGAAGLSYPQVFGMPRGFGAGLDVAAVHHYDPAFAENTFSLTLNGNYKGIKPRILERQRPLTVVLKTSFEYSQLKCNQDLLSSSTSSVSGTICSADSKTPPGSSFYAIVGPSARWDLTDDPLNPHSGAFIELGTEYGRSLLANLPDFIRAQAKVNVYVPVTQRTQLAFSMFGGRIFKLSIGDVPINRRYFAGGRGTIRGYPEQSLFAQDEPPGRRQISPGGLILMVLRNEFRFPILGALGGALFYDVGDLYQNWHDVSFSNTPRQGVGFDLRFETPVGPLAFGFGVPLVLTGYPSESHNPQPFLSIGTL